MRTDQIKEGQIVYYFDMDEYTCSFAKVKVDRDRGEMVTPIKVYFKSKYEVLDVGKYRYVKNSQLYKKFSTIASKLERHGLMQVAIESAFNNGHHGWISRWYSLRGKW